MSTPQDKIPETRTSDRRMLVAASFALALGLGVSGFRASGFSWSDSLYRSAQLFLLDGGQNPNGTWQIQIARFLAPLSLSTATVRGLIGIAKANSGVVGGRLWSRDHLILVASANGSQQGTATLADVARDPRYRQGRALVQISADLERLPRALKIARAARASEIVISVGDDEDSLNIVHRIRELLAMGSVGASDVGPLLHAELQSAALWQQLERIEFAGRARTSWFHRGSVTARMLIRESRTTLLEGMTICSTDDATRLTVMDQGGVTGVDFLGGLDAPGVYDSGFVCHDHAEETLLRATEMTALIKRGGLLVCVCPTELGSVISRIGLDEGLEVRTIDPVAWVLPWIETTTEEMLAQAVHSEYLRLGQESGWLTDDDESNVAWEELPDSLKASSRAFARAVAGKLDGFGLKLRPLVSADESPFEFDDAELNELGRAEHDRWVAEREAAGWTLGPKDPQAKTNPNLVPWNDLSELEQSKDKDLVRAIPAWLRNFGLVIHR